MSDVQVATAGLYLSHTKTPGHVYELSAEHHIRTEIKFDHVENWDLNAPQTEEESGESPAALSLELDWSKNITIANYHAYRVARSRAAFPAAVRLYHSENIHFRNLHVNAKADMPLVTRMDAAPSCAQASVRTAMRSRI